jgi:hypothetical protein
MHAAAMAVADKLLSLSLRYLQQQGIDAAGHDAECAHSFPCHQDSRHTLRPIWHYLSCWQCNSATRCTAHCSRFSARFSHSRHPAASIHRHKKNPPTWRVF